MRHLQCVTQTYTLIFGPEINSIETMPTISNNTPIDLYLPEDHLAERTYIAEYLFSESLGIPIRIFPSSGHDWQIQITNHKKIIIPDAFWSHIDANHTYLQANYLPIHSPKLLEHSALPAGIGHLPIIYGTTDFYSESNKIFCGLDIFASSFFMLTRWEEYVSSERDIHDRFPGSTCYAYRNRFIQEPIVDNYVDLLWALLSAIDYQGERIPRSYRILLTHDVDHPYYYPSLAHICKRLAGDLVCRKSIAQFTKRIHTLLSSQRDPFDTFEYLMDCSESKNTRSHFFWMAGKYPPPQSHFDYPHPRNKKRIHKLVKSIKDRGHVLGFHPGYNTCNNPTRWKQELEFACEFLGQDLRCGRQHFLKFSAPHTWQIWEDNNMEWDSTLGYPDQPGFRCGTCHPFHPFNFLTRKKLNLLEYPLTAMECTFTHYLKQTPEAMLENVCNLIDRVKNKEGTFVLLWHNSSFNTKDYLQFRPVYPAILKLPKES